MPSHTFPMPIIPGADLMSPKELAAAREVLFKPMSPGTMAVYQKHWGYFVQWAYENGHEPLPASPDVINSYISSLNNKAPSTTRNAAAAIRKAHTNAGHQSPTMDPSVRVTLALNDKANARPLRQSTPLTQKHFLAIKEQAYIPKPSETPHHANRRAATDIALIAFMRDTLCRRSEAAAARWQDIEENPDGTIQLRMAQPETDLPEEDTPAYISQETQALLAEMVESRGQQPKPSDRIFRIAEKQVSNRIQAAAEHANLEGNFSGESPRAGMAKDLGWLILPTLVEPREPPSYPDAHP